MASSSGNQGVGLRRFYAGCFEKHQLRLGFGVVGLESSRIAQDDRTHLFKDPHRTDVSWPQVQDHNLFWVNIQVHDSRLRKLGLRNSDAWQQEPYRYQMHQPQKNFLLKS